MLPMLMRCVMSSNLREYVVEPSPVLYPNTPIAGRLSLMA